MPQTKQLVDKWLFEVKTTGIKLQEERTALNKAMKVLKGNMNKQARNRLRENKDQIKHELNELSFIKGLLGEYQPK